MQQSGLHIRGNNIRINFNESFKNIARYYFYFDQPDFIYTGITGENELIMRFQKSSLVYYKANKLQYPQKLAEFASHDGRLSAEAKQIILANHDFGLEKEAQAQRLRRCLNI